ncbi:hypothetical protein GDO78_014290 [Eleutherodactylus coqui]|uniref:Uncharacterized protein n=1 Tax=Eleutherodactylus coqui TaxID=57060 RepID=A0A8J6EEZ2_ELECQ|nr:hypothetical protein GDO78_014290 [Eleutherodactylus coqui]
MDPDWPRDIICRVHRYRVKETIMKRAWKVSPIQFQGRYVQLFPDLSQLTLMKRKSLRPLLDTLHQHNIEYMWGFPFRLQVRHGGRLIVLRNPGDLAKFSAALDIPMQTIQDWPYLQPLPPGGEAP